MKGDKKPIHAVQEQQQAARTIQKAVSVTQPGRHADAFFHVDPGKVKTAVEGPSLAGVEKARSFEDISWPSDAPSSAPPDVLLDDQIPRLRVPSPTQANVASSTQRQTEDQPLLSSGDLCQIGPKHTNSWEGRILVLARKTRVKYNVAAVTGVTLSHHSIPLLMKRYHSIDGLPSFTHGLLKAGPSVQRGLMYFYPDMFRFYDVPGLQGATTLLKPNPEYLDVNSLLKSVHHADRQRALKSLKNTDSGLALVTMYVHPRCLPERLMLQASTHQKLKELQKWIKEQVQHDLSAEPKISVEHLFKYLRYGADMKPPEHHSSFSKLPRSASQKEIKVIVEESGIPYFASIFDLDSCPEISLKYLIDLRNKILIELTNVYGVTKEDKIKIYLHMPYLEATTTLHVHIRVNQADHAVEDSKSFGISEIIEILSKGGRVADLILSRGEIYCSSYPICEGIPGATVRTVPNLRRDWKDLISVLCEGDERVKSYLLKCILGEDIAFRKRLSLVDADEVQRLITVIEAHYSANLKLPSEDELLKMVLGLNINVELLAEGWNIETGEREVAKAASVSSAL